MKLSLALNALLLLLLFLAVAATGVNMPINYG
jgi:hypothetical protein